jgi:hypothetical protein
LYSLCNSGCPEKCDTVEYILETSFSTYPALSKLKEFQDKYPLLIPQNVSDAELIDFVERGLIKLNINYKDIYYNSIVENPAITAVYLVSSLRGNLCLFLGIIVLSLSEIFDLLVSLFMILNNHFKPKNKIEQSRKIEIDSPITPIETTQNKESIT